jgi:putative N6-adenine-specific DNA methylase
MAALFLPCAQGVEALLALEVQRIIGGSAPDRPDLQAVQAARGGVWVEGDEHTAMLLNLECRLAQRVLWPLVDGPYRDEHDLYEMACSVDWPHWITPQQTLRVDVSAGRGKNASPLTSLNFAALRIKDAVCDTLRQATGERPSVDTRHPDLPISLFAGPESAALYIDTSGDALFKRGWREDTGEAPLKETLAAAMLAAANWQGRAEDGPLLDPCCGAGTIAIEAAQMACGIAAGSLRHFAFERMRPFQPYAPAWRALKLAAQQRVHAPRAAVFAGDVSFRMTDFAQRNAQRAGVAHAIDFKTADALQRPAPAERGTLIMNPPYGERIEPKGSGQGPARSDARASAHQRASDRPTSPRQAFEDSQGEAVFYSGLATQWKRHYPGWTAWVLSPDARLPGQLRLKESRRVPLWNGAIECRLFRFDMTAGAGPGAKAQSPAEAA